MHGVLNLNKPSGPTSHDIVAMVRRILGEKRVGHTGTLDPLATGVLVLCIGKATRIAEYLTAHDKEYEGVLVLGRTTDSQDSAGEETSSTDASHITRQMIEDTIPRFTGKIMQIPPMVSAVKHQGKRLYELARNAVEVERQPREVTISRLEITSFQPGNNPTVGLSVACSSGTYIRTLCADIGEALGVGGYMASLVRTRVGQFVLSNSLSLDELEQASREQRLDGVILQMGEALSEFPAVTADSTQSGIISHGGTIASPVSMPDGTLVRILNESDVLLAIGRAHADDGGSVITPEKVFAEAGSFPVVSGNPFPETDSLPSVVSGHPCPETEPPSKSAVTVGVFDGVHVGHQMLLGVLRSEAARLGGLAVVFTFEAHPAELLAPERAPLYITTPEQKLKLLKEAGADLVVVSQFDRELADLTPEEFVDRVIVQHLKGASIVVGSNFRFGHKRAGDVELLRRLGEERGLRVIVAEPAISHGAPVSSTRVRNALMRGDVELARQLLGRPFSLLGKVVAGLGLGKKLGYPTANIEVGPRQLIPMDGVYAVRATLEGKEMPGVCSIGTRPTIGDTARAVEVLIDGFEGDLYGLELVTAFHARLREQIKFESLEELTEQIAADIEKARSALAM